MTTCYLCAMPASLDDDFCWGCREVICDAHIGVPLGQHDAPEHDEDYGDDEDDDE